LSEIAADPVAAAEAADLTYVNDAGPGIRRQKTASGFRYTGVDGRPLRDTTALNRIKHLAIPPAWSDVWISPIAKGHLQATGRDARGRKQYRYHARWREVRDRTKYDRLVEFAEALPSVRERVEADLGLPRLPREKMLATVVRLLESTLIRVGNREYARDNKSYGLTTMRDRHVSVDGSQIKFEFKGKSGKVHSVGVRDRRLARIVRQCQEIPGHELFQYVDESGTRRNVGSADVNAYLREISGKDFTAKDFRTWAGTVLAATTLKEFAAFESATQAKRNLVQATEEVAHRLGNTAAICRKCYIHPDLVEDYLEGKLLASLHPNKEKASDRLAEGLQPEEQIVLGLLKEHLRAAAAGVRAAS